jgi:hypothetical protein
MALFTADAQYASMYRSPDDTNTGPSFPLATETIEMTNFDDRHGNASGSLLRRRSETSVASDTSSEMQTQRYRTLNRVMQAGLNYIANLESNVQEYMRQSRFYGWRMGIVFGSTMSAFVLCCNIIAIVVASSLGIKKNGHFLDVISADGVAISRWSAVFHVIINVFSTILLAASNYTMQVLCSPTRSDLDAAHAKGLWLDVGLPSLRNLRYLPRGRVALGLLLGFSSIPLHLL